MSQNPRVTIKPHDQRVAKLINDEITEKYLWANLTTLLAIYNPDNSLKERFEYATQRMPIAMTMGSDKYHLHYDQVGSLRAMASSFGLLGVVAGETGGLSLGALTGLNGVPTNNPCNPTPVDCD
jgi:hypothetical protein